MESLSQGDSSANSSDLDDALDPASMNASGLPRIPGRMTGKPEVIPSQKARWDIPTC
jgi:hypothetical protein